MSKTVTQRELRNDSGRILRAVEQGEEFIVTRNGSPVARLGPVETDRTFVSRERLIESFAGLPHVDPGRFRADLEEFMDFEMRDPYERHRHNDD